MPFQVLKIIGGEIIRIKKKLEAIFKLFTIKKHTQRLGHSVYGTSIHENIVINLNKSNH
jgi:hypothetical protein